MSCRFNKSKNFKANIYLPYEINNKELLFQEFENFIKSNNQYNFNKHEVIIHPVKKNVNEHIKFMNEIKKGKIVVRNKDGWTGHSVYAPYMFIHVGAGADKLPNILYHQFHLN